MVVSLVFVSLALLLSCSLLEVRCEPANIFPTSWLLLLPDVIQSEFSLLTLHKAQKNVKAPSTRLFLTSQQVCPHHTAVERRRVCVCPLQTFCYCSCCCSSLSRAFDAAEETNTPVQTSSDQFRRRERSSADPLVLSHQFPLSALSPEGIQRPSALTG